MGRRPATPKPTPRGPSSRGNRRTRGGAGRHNLSRGGLNGGAAKVRLCLGCNHPFKSRGPWNRFCSRCHQGAQEHEHDNNKAFRVPKEWPAGVLHDDL